MWELWTLFGMRQEGTGVLRGRIYNLAYFFEIIALWTKEGRLILGQKRKQERWLQTSRRRSVHMEEMAVLDNVVGVDTGRGLGHMYVLKIKLAAFVDGWVESVRERKGQG